MGHYPIHSKANYLKRIRKDSCYPAFRAIVNMLAVLLYLIAFLLAASSMYAYADRNAPIFLMIGVPSALVIAFLARVFQEASSFMIADIADSTIDLHSKYEQQ